MAFEDKSASKAPVYRSLNEFKRGRETLADEKKEVAAPRRLLQKKTCRHKGVLGANVPMRSTDSASKTNLTPEGKYRLGLTDGGRTAARLRARRVAQVRQEREAVLYKRLRRKYSGVSTSN
ncbi:hypothetical protein EVAR_12433_1 [Eumeta japonica]|uniref:Uncharacterized protein n=1 Tax=Eumeta variegata TaxID=151549 RepID=A0A4C1TZ82_EUMVA|nr:hypothetical protein EVAR_12433_1 [Eumeta japonica]